MEIYDIVKKLLGDIRPVGETNCDYDRYGNLENTIKLIDKLLFDIDIVSNDKNRPEYSMKRAGEKAHQFLKDISSQYSE